MGIPVAAESVADASGRELLFKPITSFFGMVVERAEPAAIDDFPQLIDNVDSFRPGRVKAIRDVTHRINAHGNGEMESGGKVIGDCDALRECLGLRVAEALIHI